MKFSAFNWCMNFYIEEFCVELRIDRDNEIKASVCFQQTNVYGQKCLHLCLNGHARRQD